MQAACSVRTAPRWAAVEQDDALPLPVGGEDGLEMAQQGGFPAAGGAAEHHEFPRLNPQAHPVQGLFGFFRVGKA